MCQFISWNILPLHCPGYTSLICELESINQTTRNGSFTVTGVYPLWSTVKVRDQ